MSPQRKYQSYALNVSSVPRPRHGRTIDTARVEPIARPVVSKPRRAQDWR